MSRVAYVNGAYVPTSDAFVHINDRGYQFADAVYEGVTVRRGKPIDLDPHLDRLWRSMGELTMAEPMARGPMRLVLSELIRRNRISDGFLYIQVSRGEAVRDHAFPSECIPSFVATCRRLDLEGIRKRVEKGIGALSQPDIRWGRCDIKSTALLPNILAKQAARQAGAFEAILVDAGGHITEGSSTNVWIVGKDGKLKTRTIKDNILRGITRMRVSDIAANLQIPVSEESFTVEEAQAAEEMFITSATTCTTPIVELDGKKIGDGTPGPVAKRLMEAYFDFMDD